MSAPKVDTYQYDGICTVKYDGIFCDEQSQCPDCIEVLRDRSGDEDLRRDEGMAAWLASTPGMKP